MGVGQVGARPQDMKKGADQGVDGRLFFHYGDDDETKQVVLSVKGGRNISVTEVRDLGHVVTREKAVMGVFITLYPPTGPMLNEAREAGEFESPWGKHPRLQILTVGDLLGGKRIDMPPIMQVNRTFKRAPKAKSGPGGVQLTLDDVAEG
jgi:restriction endonuclease